VLTRGTFDPLLKRDTGVAVEPDLLPPFPTLLEAAPPKAQIAVRTGETLVLHGHHLLSPGDTVVARFTEPSTSHTVEVTAVAGASGTMFQVKIPPDAAPGVYGVAAIVRHAGKPEHVSNELAVALAPTIRLPITVSSAGGEAKLTVKCSPKARVTQRITLVVGDQEIAGEPVLASPVDTRTDTVLFRSRSLASGSHPVRLRVDGVESILVDRSVEPPAYRVAEGHHFMSAISGCSWVRPPASAAAVGVVRSQSKQHVRRLGDDGNADGADQSVHVAEETLRALKEGMPAASGLDTIGLAFRLSGFEREMLVLCAGVELDGGFAAQCAVAQGDQRSRFASFSLGLAALPDGH
jgi:hypothetical protein